MRKPRVIKKADQAVPVATIRDVVIQLRKDLQDTKRRALSVLQVMEQNLENIEAMLKQIKD